jgi:hypothetical protein
LRFSLAFQTVKIGPLESFISRAPPVVTSGLNCHVIVGI